jgi:hypothetical protein
VSTEERVSEASSHFPPTGKPGGPKDQRLSADRYGLPSRTEEKKSSPRRMGDVTYPREVGDHRLGTPCSPRRARAVDPNIELKNDAEGSSRRVGTVDP